MRISLTMKAIKVRRDIFYYSAWQDIDNYVFDNGWIINYFIRLEFQICKLSLFIYFRYFIQISCSSCIRFIVYVISEISIFLRLLHLPFLSCAILFLSLNQHPFLFPVRDPRHLIRLNPNSSPLVLSGTFGRDVGRPKAIRRKGMRNDRGSLYVRARAKSGGSRRKCETGVCISVCIRVGAYIRSPRLQPSLRRGLRTQ